MAKQAKQAKQATKAKAKASKPAAAPAVTAPPVPVAPEPLVNLFARIPSGTHRKLKAAMPFSGMRQEGFIAYCLEAGIEKLATADPRVGAVLKLVA